MTALIDDIDYLGYLIVDPHSTVQACFIDIFTIISYFYSVPLFAPFLKNSWSLSLPISLLSPSLSPLSPFDVPTSWDQCLGVLLRRSIINAPFVLEIISLPVIVLLDFPTGPARPLAPPVVSRSPSLLANSTKWCELGSDAVMASNIYCD